MQTHRQSGGGGRESKRPRKERETTMKRELEVFLFVLQKCIMNSSMYFSYIASIILGTCVRAIERQLKVM